MVTIPSTREAILEAFRGLSPDEQRAVAHAVNQELQMAGRAAEQSTEPQPGHPGWVSWRQLVGLFDTGQEPPSDEQAQQWLEEARVETYGG